jgi:hydroxymethylpyrimidine pyrophosphatase-like HAD family hydrolase/energy-coupling factor transporter ATP-binding protein EcfA2
LQRVFPRLDLFTYVVAENGALLYHPASSTEQVLGEAPPRQLLQALQERGVPFSTGRVIVATWHPHETTVVEVIGKLGLERQVIFNKGAVMVLPTGVNKGTGLAAALREMKVSPHNVVGIGDAENDQSFLSMCECSVAVANALPALKEQADYTTRADHGDGVVELIEQLLADDLKTLDQRTSRHVLLLGTREQNEKVFLKTHRTSVLLAGPSGSGKSTLTFALLEQLVEQAYQVCLIDPEGDYETFQGAITLGDAHTVPGVTEVVELLEKSEHSAIINLLGTPLADRPGFFRNLLPALLDLQIRLGHPHWLILDEAHHLFPPEWDTSILQRIKDLFSTLYITAHITHVSRQILAIVDVVVGVGTDAPSTLRNFAQTAGQNVPETLPSALEKGEALVWFRRTEQAPVRIKPAQSRQEHQRHRRKYAEGDLGEENSFYFRGPQGKLKLRAQNLALFVQIAQGVDDETWLFHLRKGDYSRWFREVVKDPELAAEAEKVEKDEKLSASESRARIVEAIEQRYTLPA